jgi:hypothetical protein
VHRTKRRTIRRSHGRRARRELTGNDNIVFAKKIEYTDFPLDEITLYFANNVFLLPSEYSPALLGPRWRGFSPKTPIVPFTVAVPFM